MSLAIFALSAVRVLVTPAIGRCIRLTVTNAYPETDCTLVCVKLADMENHKAVIYPRFQIGGRWFYDIVENNARREEEKRTGTEG